MIVLADALGKPVLRRYQGQASFQFEIQTVALAPLGPQRHERFTGQPVDDQFRALLAGPIMMKLTIGVRGPVGEREIGEIVDVSVSTFLRAFTV